MKYRIEIEKVGSYSETLYNTDSAWDEEALRAEFKEISENDESIKDGWYKMYCKDNESDEIISVVEF